MEFIDLKQQYRNHKKAIDEAIFKVLEEGQFIMGPQVQQLEDTLAAYIGVKHCIGVSSGTDSLLIALMALDVGPGDEVITVPFTWIASSEVIKLIGAKPVFVDIDPDTYNIDAAQIEQAITARTKALLPVNLFGQMADYTAINCIAAKYGLPVIEDAAQSFGSTQHKKQSCGVTTIGSTSFFPAKPLGCYGDGGALFTDDDALAAKIRAIRTHGGENRHHHPYLGLNGRLDTIQAAILLAKWPHYPAEIAARQQIGARYTELLENCCITPKIMEGNTHIYAQYTIRLPNRDEMQAFLKQAGIPSAVYYPKCLHEQPIFADLGYALGSFPHAEKASKEVLSLPMHPWLNDEDQERIVEIIRNHAYIEEPCHASQRK